VVTGSTISALSRMGREKLVGLVEGRGLEPSPVEIAGPPGNEPTREAGFVDYLRAQVNEVENLNAAADKAAGDLVSGRSGDIHGTMIALEKADISFRLLTKVRNKVVEAYQEVMRMNV